jgi:hypothetical protein
VVRSSSRSHRLCTAAYIAGAVNYYAVEGGVYSMMARLVEKLVSVGGKNMEVLEVCINNISGWLFALLLSLLK